MKNVDKIIAFEGEITSGNLKSTMSGAGAKSRDLWYVPVKELSTMDGFNPRVKDERYTVRVRKLADSMKSNGYFPDKPLAVVVSDTGIKVVEGGTRLDAVKLAISEGAPIEAVPCVSKDRTTSMEDLTVGLVMGNDGERFTPFELAVVVKRLAGFGHDSDSIASKLQVTSNYVEHLKTLIGAPSAIRELVQSGSVSAQTAVDAMRKHGAKAVEVLTGALKQAQSEGKVKASAKHMPGAKLDNFMKKSGPRAFETIQSIAKHDAYAALPDELKSLISGLLDDLKNADKPKAKAEKPPKVKATKAPK